MANGIPRICMPTARGFNRWAFQCSLYEAQDVICAVDDVDLVHLEPLPGFRFKENWQRRLLFRDLSRRLIFANPGLRRVKLTKEYDLFVAVCQNYWDLLYLNAIDGWKDQCRTTALWIDEMWVSDIPFYKYWLHALDRFDHIFVGYGGTAAPLAAATGRPCHWLPYAVDTLRFSPYPDPPPRAIDVYSMGRRWEGTHQVLLDAARRENLFYVYDTFASMANMKPYSLSGHREYLASLAKRSKYFVVAPGKMNRPDETVGQVEPGYRYYEAAAAGAVMIGQAPDTAAFRDLFPWSDVVVPIQPDGSDVLEVLSSLNSDPDRTSSMSRRNTAEALRRHDWLHRWKVILDAAGLGPTDKFVAREESLNALAGAAMAAGVARN